MATEDWIKKLRDEEELLKRYWDDVKKHIKRDLADIWTDENIEEYLTKLRITESSYEEHKQMIKNSIKNIPHNIKDAEKSIRSESLYSKDFFAEYGVPIIRCDSESCSGLVAFPTNVKITQMIPTKNYLLFGINIQQ